MIQLSDVHLHDAVRDVLTGLVGGALDEQQSEQETVLSASVTIEGQFDGQLVVRCTETTARRLAAGMFDEDPDELPHADVADALGEVANQVGGVVKTLVPAPSSLGLPVVVAAGAAAQADLPFLSSVSLDREEGRVDVFVFGRPTAC
jgi:CheY-specific phosphatase CheX